MTTLDELRRQLARAEQEYACAEMIDETSRQQEERARWAGEIERLRAEIDAREEGWSGLWKAAR
jgi:hypothetical protein